jgi:HK97 family phage major capsid protein
LVDFTEDGTTEITEATDISFKLVKYSLKEKAAFIPLSNTLLNMTDNDLISYIASVFAKKAVITENAMAISTLKTGKTAKSLADWKALKKSMNKDLSESVKYGTVIVTNQDGFDALDSALDTVGRPILTPDVTNPSIKRFNGYPVAVFDNSLIPTTGTTTKTAPIFYGLLSEAVKFVDNGSYEFAISTEAAFLKNLTLARVIEHVDVAQADSSDLCYIYGTLAVA